MSKIKILSIDGGGIRGILPGVILTRLEEKLQKQSEDESVRIADFFRFISWHEHWWHFIFSLPCSQMIKKTITFSKRCSQSLFR